MTEIRKVETNEEMFARWNAYKEHFSPELKICESALLDAKKQLDILMK